MKEYIKSSIETKQKILNDEIFLSKIQNCVDSISDALRSGKKILFAGNGGSASDCNHLATELVSKFYKERNALNAISLAANNSTLTAIANDYGFEKVFSRQVEAFGENGDVLFVISTSGMSKNILAAIEAAKAKGLFVIGLIGEKPCDMDDKCDILLKIPSSDTPIIQESHIMLGHLICKMVEERISI